MKGYNNEYYLKQLEKYNSKNKLSNKNKKISKGNFTIEYVETVFARLDGYLYRNFREWSNFPVLKENSITWMSITPLEIDSHIIPIELANGRVCIGGLGLGYYLQNIIDKPDVTEIVVYEINKDVIDLYNECFEHNDKVKIINDNILNMKNEHFDFVYVDIYPSLMNGPELEHMKLLKENNDIDIYYFWGFEGYVIRLIENLGMDKLESISLDKKIIILIYKFITLLFDSEYNKLYNSPYLSEGEIKAFINSL